MLIFYPNDKMVDLVRKKHELLPVLNRFGISLGFGDKTVEEICSERAININFFLAIVNTYTIEEYFPEKELLSFSPVEIIDYLKRTHQYYMQNILPEMENFLGKIMENCDKPCDDLKLIELFYKNYRKELIHHIMEEEELVFPYVLRLVEKNDRPKDHPGIRVFEKEHSNVEIKLNDLKNLILKYVNPGNDVYSCQAFLSLLFRFEKDLLDHARIEDKILVPMVMRLEKKLTGAG